MGLGRDGCPERRNIDYPVAFDQKALEKAQQGEQKYATAVGRGSRDVLLLGILFSMWLQLGLSLSVFALGSWLGPCLLLTTTRAEVTMLL